MKQFIAKYASSTLMVVAASFVFTASIVFIHRPSTPLELLKK
jgi:cyclic lactone autoinducer peptide